MSRAILYHRHSLCKYRGKSSCVGSTGAFIYFVGPSR
nr:MAG TPA: hypothetical protein [Caudoviricetes sp.]